MEKSSFYVRKITLCAVFLSISLALKTAFSFHIPLFGQNGLRIGISGIFSMMPSILFGPIYGAITSGLADFLGYLLKPTGPYMPLMTLIVMIGGFLRGMLFMILRNKNNTTMRTIVLLCSLFFLILGILNITFLASDGVNKTFYHNTDIESIHTDDMHLISKLLILRTHNTKNPSKNLETYIIFVTKGLTWSAFFGILLLLVDLVISKKFLPSTNNGQTTPLLIAMICTGLIVTTLNTILLRETIYTAWKTLPFTVIWIPRVIEEILGNTVKSYFIAILLGFFNKHHSLKELTNT